MAKRDDIARLKAATEWVNREHPLPRCPEGHALRDGGGELLIPSCGCRILPDGRSMRPEELYAYVAALEAENAALKAANDANVKEVAFLYRQLRAVTAGEGWRCFHCNVTFYDRTDALEHFGESNADTPKCLAERVRTGAACSNAFTAGPKKSKPFSQIPKEAKANEPEMARARR